MVRVHRRAECSSSCEGLNWGRELDGRKLACFLNLRATRSLASSTHPHLHAFAQPMIMVSAAASTQSPRPGTACSPARCPAAPPSARPAPAISHEQPPENVRHPTELTRRGSKNGARPCNPPHQDSLPSVGPCCISGERHESSPPHNCSRHPVLGKGVGGSEEEEEIHGTTLPRAVSSTGDKRGSELRSTADRTVVHQGLSFPHDAELLAASMYPFRLVCMIAGYAIPQQDELGDGLKSSLRAKLCLLDK